MRVATFRRWRGKGWGFEGIRELTISVVPAASAKDALRRSPFTCRRGGPELTIYDCLQCIHFVNWRPEPGQGRAQIRCLFTDDDPVKDLMTLPEGFVVVDPSVTAAEADRIAVAQNVRHLLVARGDEIVGVVCRCDIARCEDRGASVGFLAATPPWCVRPDASLSEVARLFREEGIGFALVVDGDALVGVISRGDLRRAGCPEDLLGAHFCVSCSSAHGVIEHPHHGVDICIDCLECSHVDAEELELGTGD